MNVLIHHNYWYWGDSYYIIMNDGLGMVSLQVDKKEPEAGCINNLSVHISTRKQGIGNELLKYVEQFAKSINLKEIYLKCDKTSFVYPWYKRNGFNPDNSRKYANNKYEKFLIKKL